MSDYEIRWEDPPPPGPFDDGSPMEKLSDLQRFVKMLEERPGAWALYKDDWLTRGLGLLNRNHPQVEWTYRRNPPEMWLEQRHESRPTYAIYGRWRG